MNEAPHADIEWFTMNWRKNRGLHTHVYLHLGVLKKVWVPNEHLYPETGGYWRNEYPREVQVAISPAGRHVHINVDGVNITPELIARLKAEEVTPRSPDSEPGSAAPAET